MRQMMIGLFAAAAVTTMTAPASACGGLFASGGCSPCATAYVSPCAQPAYSYGYATTYAVAAYQTLPDPTPQYFYVNQGPVYSGPGNFAPAPVYREATVSYAPSYAPSYRYGYRSAYRPWRGYATPRYGYSGYRYGYSSQRFGHAPMRHHWRHHMQHSRHGYAGHRQYGYSRGGYGHPRQHVLRRYN